MQIELGTKKATLHDCILKLCSVLSTSNHAAVSSKDQDDFYKGYMGNQLRELNMLHRLNHRRIIRSVPQLIYANTITPLNYSPGPFPINYLTYNPLH